MTATVALVLGVLAALGTLLASVRVRRPVALIFPVMMTSWLVGELAVFHLVAQLVVAGVFVAAGALGSATGQAGVALLVVSAGGLVLVQRRANRAEQAFEQALRDGLGDDYGELIGGQRAPAIEPPPPRQAWRPFRFDHAGVDVVRGIAYEEHPVRNRLDVYRPAGTKPTDALPVVLFIHGGAWVIGNKDQQGKPMLLHLARRGYIGVTINYRLGPRDRWPAQIVDVKRAIAWVREHIAEYGGDPSFLAVAGGSAGGHLAALAALTPGEPAFQPGFETADTSVTACIPIYAPFDLTNQAGLRGRVAMRRLLERLVMPAKLSADQEGWRAASPVFHSNADVPPMLVIQGTIDNLVWREETRQFVQILRGISSSPVVYAEVPGAQHAFDVFNSVRCRAAVDAIARFLAAVRQDRPAAR
ncbi:MAG: alpha/beta hydrolase fold domain-containing protein [Acidimicrobiia bacterium]